MKGPDSRGYEKMLYEDGNVCTECNKHTLTGSRGEMFCRKCGLVANDEIFDMSGEWRKFKGEESPGLIRGGSPMTVTRHDNGVSTEIGRAGEIIKVPAKKRAQYKRMGVWHKRVTTSKERNLLFALPEVQRLVSLFGFPHSVHERIAREYRRAHEKGLPRWYSTELVVGALIYSMCRESGAPHTLNEIAESVGTERRFLSKAYRAVSRGLGMRILPTQPTYYVPRFASALGLKEDVQTKALEMLGTSISSGKGPAGMAAAAIYVASLLGGESRTQRDVAEATGVTEVTIRNISEELAKKFGVEDEMKKKRLGYKDKEEEIDEYEIKIRKKGVRGEPGYAQRSYQRRDWHMENIRTVRRRLLYEQGGTGMAGSGRQMPKPKSGYRRPS